MGAMTIGESAEQGYLGVKCVPRSLLNELDELARKHDRSRSAEVRRLLREGVRRESERVAA